MNITNNKPFFSILIPTRNRPEIMIDALNSVLHQNFNSYEIIIINDGSEEQYIAEYYKTTLPHKDKVTLLSLEKSLNGHGPSYALNMGVEIAKGKYIAFLDDDDVWTSNTHLTDAQKAIEAEQADLYLSLQKAYKNDLVLDDEIWLTPLVKLLNNTETTKINIETLLKSNGFSHRNNLIISTLLYKTLKGHDENLRYEEDREFYFRAIDHADKILFNPSFISRHNIPNNKISNLSSSASKIEKQLSRLYLLDKLFIQSKSTALKKYLALHKVYTLKLLTEILYQDKKYLLASHYSKQALLLKFNLKWLSFTLYLTIKNIYGS